MFVSGAEENHPSDTRVQAQTIWAADYFGMQSYSLLTAYAHFALQQRLENLHQLDREADRLIALGDPPNWAARERLSMIQWDEASQVCMMIEELAALTTAVDAWRRDRADIAETYLGWQGDIAATIADPRWHDAAFWLGLVGYPGHNNLRDLGMSDSEATAYAGAVDATMARVITGVEWARAFFTDDMRRVYARFKHGFSLVNPLSTPVAIDVQLAPAAAQRILGGSLLVLDRARRGPIRVLAMRCSGYDLSSIGLTASLVAGTASFLAGSMVEGGRSDVRRGMVLTTEDLVPLPEPVQRAAEVYAGVERGAGSYRMHRQDEVIRLQRELQASAERYRTPPLPLPAPMR